jgi:hypothetical protein
MLPFCDIIHLYHFYSVFRLARKLFQESQQYETKLNCLSFSIYFEDRFKRSENNPKGITVWPD